MSRPPHAAAAAASPSPASRPANPRLSRETSPYLCQHADNPVDWYPWNAEALALARTTARPILLSIGYSACHWCHVMAHESFADTATAALMNAHFVNIKVDREERPDLDHIYQTAHQLMTGRPGGWPLTLFLTPAGVPIYAGTYFPPRPRHGLPAFADVLTSIANAWQQRREEIEARGRQFCRVLAHTLPDTPTETRDFIDDPLSLAVTDLAHAFDPRWGGFGAAPKFPHASDLDLLLLAGTPAALSMATTTLTRMADGGLFDQLGGGFYRYSVDERWQIPHFEKMLYDNALLLRVYSDAWAVTGDARYREIVVATAEWVMREMQSPSGGYFASLDADAAGEEGAFYVWPAGEIEALLSAEEAAVALPHWGLSGPPNFFEGAAAGGWHLRVATPLHAIADDLGISPQAARQRLDSARDTLRAARARRPAPARDEKILAGWNALMVEAMLHAARVFGRPEWAQSARRAYAFVRQFLWRDRRLYAACDAQGQASAAIDACLDDYAYWLAATLELLQECYSNEDLLFASAVADALVDAFEDRPQSDPSVAPAHAGFFFTRHDHEALILRPKPAHDNATPAGNGVAAHALLRLGQLCGETRWQAAAEGVLALFHEPALHSPAGFASWLMALHEWQRPPSRVVIRGPAAYFAPWRAALNGRYLSSWPCLFIPNGTPNLPPALALPESDHVNAWVCAGVKCLPAISGVAALLEALSKPGKVK
ncbi:thioredoxin domain-containing protein [Rhodocyclus tenuis]|uniref:Thioredoxin domain-containing protein n=1 Tax=Rhodocyclus gracilis TaxID=2929842 RepID=A0ABX0WHU2_9RHOO|nr:thioredoxin domain-containing protein [Rhodocyclus gracilis]NJA89279.1 thioredoxin domain-containing protein [Rhodocyclus gracilis]